MSDKIVVLGEIPDDFNTEKYIAFAPYCFINREHIYPKFENIEFEPDPYTGSQLKEIDKTSTEYCLLKVKEIGDKLNREYGSNYPFEVWKIILNPWLLYLIQITVEREQRVKNFITKHKDKKLTILALKDDISWDFKDSLDFITNGCLTVHFNEWLTSRIFEKNLPSNWEIKYYSREIKKKPSQWDHPRFYSKAFKNLTKRCNYVYGFSYSDKILFSLFSSFYKKSKKKLSNLNSDINITNFSKINWSFDFDKILCKTIPENLINVRLINKKRNAGKIRLISAINVYFFDSEKFSVAEAVLNKEIVIGTQHGGHNYGSAAICGFLNILEYSTCNNFFTWGWEKQGNIYNNFTKLPSPYLKEFQNRYNKENNKIILVGNRAWIHFRFDSLPTPLQWLEYRKQKALLINKLYSKKDIWNNFYYRPYSTEEDSFLDKTYFKQQFNTLKFIEGDLHNELLKCRLLILDHPGTTLNIALTSNTPTICFWNKNHFMMTDEVQNFFIRFKSVNMFFDDVDLLFSFIAEKNNQIVQWWYSEQVQKLRAEWCSIYALTSNNWRMQWVRAIKNL